MILKFIALYRARKDLAVAKRLAGEMLVDGVIDRAGWPLAIAKLWMTAGVIILTALVLLFILIGSASHWSLAIPALPLIGAIYGIVKLWRGINVGVERVTQLAKLELANRATSPSFSSHGQNKTQKTENNT